MKSPALVFIGLLLLPCLGSAASLDACRALDADLERLACYDAAVGRDLVETATVEAEVTQLPLDELTAEEAPFSNRVAEEGKLNESPYAILPHRRNYLLPVTYNSKINREPFEAVNPDVVMDEFEAKFQISFKARMLKDILGGGDLWAAYTQQSWWQVYNDIESAPFRETNYEPEIMMVWQTGAKLGSFTNGIWTLGLNHQSNGQGNLFSRSWNRIIAGTTFERDNFVIAARAWYRLPEDKDSDDNPNMDDYYGHGDLKFIYQLEDMEFAATVRNNLKGSGDNKGAIELEWTKPVNRRFKWYVQYFYGYGESLIDYNVKTNRIGVGFALNNLI